jgi:hypothetical protein
MTDYTSQIGLRASTITGRHMLVFITKLSLVSLVVALIAYPIVNKPRFHPGDFSSSNFDGGFKVDRTEFPLVPGVSYNVTAAHQHYFAVKGLPWILQVSWNAAAE